MNHLHDDTRAIALKFPSQTGSIGIFATPKTGNMFLRYCLVKGLGLTSVDVNDADELRAYLTKTDDTSVRPSVVLHTHIAYSQKIHEYLRNGGVTPITILRHPIDIFLSLVRHHRRAKSNEWPDSLLLNDDTLETFIHDIFPCTLGTSASWAKAGAIVVRFEEMVTDTQATIGKVLRSIGATDNVEEIVKFISSISHLDMLRSVATDKDKGHFSVGTVDQWKDPINRRIYDIFISNDVLRETILSWGYSVDLDEPSKVVGAPEIIEPLAEIDKFENGIPFSHHLKAIFYLKFYSGRANFDVKNPMAIDNLSFFAWLSSQSEVDALSNIEFETLRLRPDVQNAFSTTFGLEVTPYRQWLLVYGAMELGLSNQLLSATARRLICL